SIVRISSPNWYSRTSLNAMPRPLKTLWYSPEKIWLTRPFVRISILRTFLRSSVVSTGLVALRLRYFDGVQNLVDDLLRRDVFRLRLIRDGDSVAQNVCAHGADILGDDIATPLDEGEGTRSERQIDARARGRTVVDEGCELFELEI